MASGLSREALLTPRLSGAISESGINLFKSLRRHFRVARPNARRNPCSGKGAALKFWVGHPYTIQKTSTWMVNLPPRPQHAKPPESEKLTINLGFIDLGSIDLMVRDGFYSNRSDFIRTAVRNQLATHAETAKKAASRLTLEMGLRTYGRKDLEAVQAAGEKLRIRVLGLAVIADDVTPDLARATIESITVLGALHASAEVKTALADRLR
jgi:Arc/MetJ-type ribon-helix-helix transcriptional regulator